MMIRMKNKTWISLCLLLGSAISQAQHLPEDFYDQLYVDRFEFPTAIQFDVDGRMYVAEKEGQIYIVDTLGAVLEEPLIDISEEVSNWKDHGLMGFVLDNEFNENGYFYLLYALDLHHFYNYGTPDYHPDSTVTWQPTIGRVVRYQADAATGYTSTVEGSRQILLGKTLDSGISLLYEFHGLGDLKMGADGTLLISSGDATSNAGADMGGDSLGTMASAAIEAGVITPDQDVGSYRSQYLGSYNGKILRIDAQTGEGLPSNPYYDAANPCSAQSRIWAWGLRNPYRFQVRPHTGSHYPEDGQPGHLYVGDVGNGAWEELDIVTEGGQNFGWPIMEGIGAHWPYYSYDPPANPLRPNPLYGNGCNQPYFTFKDVFVNPREDGAIAPANPCNTALPVEDYVVGTPPTLVWSNSRWNPPTRAQVPVFGDNGFLTGLDIGTEQSGITGEVFDGYSALAGVFYEGDNFPQEYQGQFLSVDFSGWIKAMTFDDDNQLLSVEPFHQYAKDIIHLELNRATGKLYYINVAGNIHEISYGGNPPPVAIISADQYYGTSPLTVQFDASESFDSNLPLVAYEWDFGDGQTTSGPAPSHVFTASGSSVASFEVALTVTDSLGASSVAKAVVSLNNTPPQVKIVSFEDGDQYPLDQGTTLLRLAAEVQDAEHADEELQYEWRSFLHHNDHFHPEPADYSPTSFALISPLGCQEEEYWYRIELTVTDPGGLATQQRQLVYPHCGDPIVEWVSLQGEPADRTIELQWEATTDSEYLEFEVHRAVSDFEMQYLGQVSGNSISQTGSYTFTDGAPRLGNNSYRIKARRDDGAYAYSNRIEVAYPSAPDFKIYPNPASSEFTAAVKEAKAEQIALILYSELGSEVLQLSWAATPGEESEQTILLHNLPNGVYFYRMVNGTDQSTGRLTVSR